MSEPSIKSNQRAAQQLYERGVAAAKGGQRRVAAGLLARAVQFDPQHEQAWLWLSGVTDDNKDIAFCLRSVLSINPHNERARQGLVWLEQRALVAPKPMPHIVEPSASVHVDEAQERSRAAWWVGWRRNRREMSHAWRFVLSGAILFLLLTMLLNQSLRGAVEQNNRQTQAALLALTPTAAPPEARPTVVAIIQPDIIAAEDARVAAYLSAIQPPRDQLRAASQSYRAATQKLGDSAVAHAAAARTFRDQIETAYTTLVEVVPPPALERAHKEYLAGLDEERQALSDMLEFYGSFSVQFANRATLRMLDAGKQFERARASFAQRQAQSNAAARLFAQTPR